MSRTKVTILGAGFIADIHAESYHRFVPDAEVVAGKRAGCCGNGVVNIHIHGLIMIQPVSGR